MDKCKICTHLIAHKDISHLKYFTGKGKEYYLICEECKENIDDIERVINEVIPETFKKIDDDIWCCIGIIGEPQILTKRTNLHFKHELIKLKNQIESDILGIAALDLNNDILVFVVTNVREILSISLSTGEVSNLYTFSEQVKIDFSEDISIHISKDGSMAAVVNTLGQNGIVIDLIDKTVLMNLDRGSYHVNSSVFPITFFKYGSEQLIIHATDWNRLDITNPKSGELLTSRSVEKMKYGEAYYLDYFHSGISISDDNMWIVDNGWIWHPVGEIVAWSIDNWLNNNVWESEKGNSKKILCQRSYYWDGAICWIDDETIAVYGFGGDDDWIIPAVRLFDVKSGKEIDWFPGPQNNLIFDGFLFSWCQNHGMEVWDVNTGERLMNDESFCPSLYHRGSKKFVTILSDGDFMLSSLEYDGTDKPFDIYKIERDS